MKKVLGIIFASMHEKSLDRLASKRTMGSVPFGGRYRLIDFSLSNMTNSGINEVGLITKQNYNSLLIHVGSGAQWDLSHKKGGLHILPPFSQSFATGGVYQGRLDALYGVKDYFKQCDAEYVVLANADTVMNINYKDVVEAHIASGKKITAVYGKYNYVVNENKNTIVFDVDDNNNVSNLYVDPQNIRGECNASLGIFVMSKAFMMEIIEEGNNTRECSLSNFLLKNFILKNKYNDSINAYKFDGYFSIIDTLPHYYKTNMELLNRENRASLFNSKAPIYTKIHDNCPVNYGESAVVKNSLIADGCVIEGYVENSIIFRGVKIGKNAIVKNSIIMQNSQILDNAKVDALIADKNTVISNNAFVKGASLSPLYFDKNTNYKGEGGE